MIKKTQWLLLVLAVVCLGVSGGLIGGFSVPLMAEVATPTPAPEGPASVDGMLWGAALGLLLGVWLLRAGWRFLKAALYLLSVVALAVCGAAVFASQFLGMSW